MKYFNTTIISLLITLNTFSQTHYCAQRKASNGVYKPNTKIVAGYIAPETNYDLKFYHLNLNVERNTAFVSGNVLSKAKVLTASLDSFAFLLHVNHTIDSVCINGVSQNFVRRDSLVMTSTGSPIIQNQLFDAVVYYHGTCPSGGTAAIGDGYNVGTSGSWGNEVSWSLSESLCAYQWFPCKQDLKDKIDSSWVYATTDSANMVGSNGLLKNVVSIGNKKRYEWKSIHPIDYYLISVSTAKYREYKLYAHPQFLVNDSIFIQNYIYDNAINNPSWATQKTALNNIVPTIELESKLYGMYPFYKEKYGHCMAPLGGGMEHQTMTTLGFFDFEIDAHELGHQWWGDHVTCKRWQDIFINEGFASYTEYLCDQYLPAISGTSASAKMTQVHNSVMSQPGGSCYFTNADTVNANVIFSSRLTYDKGSAVIHMIRYEINNDSVFFPMLRAFQSAYSFSTASVPDFKLFVENFTGKNFTQFFNQWYYGQGYPTFNVKWNQVGNNTLYIKNTQTQSMASSVPLFITPLDYRVVRSGKPDTILRLTHDQLIENYTLPLTGTVTAMFIDPANWILNKVLGPTKDVTLGVTTGIDELNASVESFVGPNPTSDILNVNLYKYETAVIEITDVVGKQVVVKEFNAHTELNVSNYANGIYIVNIKNKAGDLLKSTKIVKN